MTVRSTLPGCLRNNWLVAPSTGSPICSVSMNRIKARGDRDESPLQRDPASSC